MQRRVRAALGVVAMSGALLDGAAAVEDALSALPRSHLAERAKAMQQSWLDAVRQGPIEPQRLLAEFQTLDRCELIERQRRLGICRQALQGGHGAVAAETATKLRQAEAALSAHVLLNPFQYIVDFRDPSYRVEVAPYAKLDVRSACTVSLWLRLEGGARIQETKVYSHSDVNDNKFNLMLEGRRLELLLGLEGGARLNFQMREELPLRRWLHVVARYEAGRGAAIYVDAQEQTLVGGDMDAEFRPIHSDPAQELYLGCLDRCLPGSLDDVRVYDRALGEREIRHLTLGEDLSKGLVAHWTLDDSSGALAQNRVADGNPGRVGERVLRGVEGAPALGGRAFGFSGKAAHWSERLARLEARIDSLELGLLAQLSPRAELSSKPAPMALRPGSADALLCYLPLGGERWLALGLCADGRNFACELTLAEKSLDTLLALWTQATRRSDERRWREASRNVAEQIWDPVERELALLDADELEIWLVLPEPWRLLPFAALVGADGEYLQTRIAFARAAPLAALQQQPRAARGRALLVGNPNFGAPQGLEQPKPVSRRSGQLRADGCFVRSLPLLGSGVELSQLSTRLSGQPALEVELLEWSAAFESQVSNAAAGASLVHLATHGYSLDATCLPRLPAEELEHSGLELGGSDILRADDQQQKDRGYLSAAALSRLDLSAAALVFFSGCETAARGQGSLSTAAWLAGAQSSLGSLVPIEDELTPRLSDRFYAEWLGGHSAARALRRASEALRQELSSSGRAHPVRWANFVLEGS